MKKNILLIALSLVLVLAFSVAAISEETPTENVETEQTSALDDAMKAYADAKSSNMLDDLEKELADMVANGQLTQEQSDLILSSANERASLQNGLCPNCGYAYTGGMGRNSRGGKMGFGGFGYGMRRGK